MKTVALIPVFVLLTLPAPAKTLKDLLQTQNIPLTSFSAPELAASVQGSDSISNPQQEELVYTLASGSAQPGPAHVIKFNKATKTVLKFTLPYDATDACSGPFEGIMAMDDFTLVSTDISPSAQCVHVLDSHLAQTKTLYGFDPHDVGHNQIVLIENMVQFAAVHPERLQFADLRSGATDELYPPKGDALRAKIALENAHNIPPPSVCGPMNDPCDPQLFDEDISVATNGKDRFALIAHQSASHALAPNQTPVTVASQWTLYLYAHSQSGWLYCESEISGDEATSLIEGPSAHPWFPEVQNRCAPTLPVAADMSSTIMNPFHK